MSVIRRLIAAAFPPTRSTHWPALERAFIAAFPSCAACGTTEHLQVHHIEPFHLYPKKELLWTNLVTLCMMPGRECHFRIGHNHDWRKFNPNVRLDALRSLHQWKHGDEFP